MKGFKKFLAGATAFAMLATTGIAAFAADDPAPGEGVQITNVSVDEVVGSEGYYTVTVDYEMDQGISNTIGATLLAYADNNGDDLDVTATYDEEDMQIVGIDQVEPASSGSFSFVVTTNEGAGGVVMAEGSTGCLLLGGDAVTKPAAATFTVGESPVPAVQISGIDSGVYGGQIDMTGVAPAMWLDTITNEIKENSDQLNLVLSSDGEPVGAITGDMLDGVAGAEIVAGYNGTDYYVSVTIPAGFKGKFVDTDEKFELVDSASCDASIARVFWMPSELTTNEVTLPSTVTEEGLNDAVKAAITEVTVTDNYNTANVTSTIADVIEVSLSEESAAFVEGSTEEQTLTYDVTLLAYAGAEFDSEFVNLLDDITSEITVKVVAASAGVPYLLGDANLNGQVEGTDWMKILDFAAHRPASPLVTEGWSMANAAADANENGQVEGTDWMKVLDYAAHRPAGDVGAERTYTENK